MGLIRVMSMDKVIDKKWLEEAEKNIDDYFVNISDKQLDIDVKCVLELISKEVSDYLACLCVNDWVARSGMD